MKIFQDKVAVITGAASGIGRSLAERCASEGMKVILAGRNEENLLQVEKEIKLAGGNVLSVRTDVSKLEDIEALAKQTLDTFGAVHLLVNNVGVGAGPNIWESTWEDWKWVIDVNLWGVIYGLKVFVPIMLDQDTEGHIVNTSSAAGLLPFHPSASYQVTKHAVVALSENLYYSLALRNSKIKTSVLCPGWVKTRILESGRNRPLNLRNQQSQDPINPENEEVMRNMAAALEAGMTSEAVAECTFKAIRDEKFYIITHPDIIPGVRLRMENILQGENPTI